MTSIEDSGWRGQSDTFELDEFVSLNELSKEALHELTETLQAKVPKRQYGDGVETYEDYILPHHADTQGMFKAAKQLQLIRMLQGDIEDGDVGENSNNIETAVLLAIATLRRHQIKYLGTRNTFVYWSDKRKRYVQIDADLRQLLLIKGQRELGFRCHKDRYRVDAGHNEDLPDRDHPAITQNQKHKASVWFQKYPWRGGSENLSSLFSLELLEPNTPLWHAIRILCCHEQIKRNRKDVENTPIRKMLTNEDVLSFVQETAELGFAIGQSANTLKKKPLEYDVVSFGKTKRARTKASGLKSASNRTKRVEAFLDEIENLGELYPRISEKHIVDEAFDKAVANDPDLWRQGKGRKETYLSQNIRSEERYKSRYYAIFG